MVQQAHAREVRRVLSRRPVTALLVVLLLLPCLTLSCRRACVPNYRCSGSDKSLPQSHTCFFSVELPQYSSEEAMMRALRIVCHYGGAGVLFG